MKRYFTPAALLPQGWGRDVRVEVDDAGTITAVTADAPPADAERLAGPLVPGMPNLHSHAFQRAMAGVAERRGAGEDSFWTWREVMYGFLAKLTPELAHAIAAQLYVELLKHGYTSVAEFHYVHNAPDGRPYANPAEMALAHAHAAREAGIAMTLMPSLYAHGAFGGAPLSSRQARFATTPEQVLRLVAAIGAMADADLRPGVSPHSLRAVGPAMLRTLLEGLDADTPVHIHVAEQTREVEDCVAWSGQRPVEWLLARFEVDRRWCLVHCTHMTDAETDALAACGAVAGLCPTTEANLGDGLFPLARYLERGGRFGIGGDSHVSRDPVEELRWLEYGQRLTLRRRNVAASQHEPSTGAALWQGALAGGAQALGRGCGAIAPGLRADLLVLDAAQPVLAHAREDGLLDALVFATDETPVRDVMVGGRWVVRDGRHAREDAIAAAYRGARAILLA